MNNAYNSVMITNTEALQRALEAKEIKPTLQRLAILKYVYENKVHPSVDLIYVNLSKVIPTMSKTTIYNTLDMFVKNGLVKSISTGGAEIRYDGDLKSHHHFICEKCNSITDIDIVCPQVNKGEICGHKINEVQGYFKGICKKCRGQ